MEKRLVFELRTPRTGEETPESMVQFLSSFTNLLTSRYYFFKKGIPFSLEIATFEQNVKFFMTVPESFGPFAISQFSSQYPKASVLEVEDYLPGVINERTNSQIGQLILRQSYLLPLKTYADFADVDPLSSLLGILSRVGKEDDVVIQFMIVPTPVSWHGEGEKQIAKKIKKADGTEEGNPYAPVIQEKIKQHGFQVGIRIFVKSDNSSLFKQVATTFSSFNNASGNSLYLKPPSMWQKDGMYQAMLNRTSDYIPKKQILNLSEIATMFHMPGENLSKLVNISWTKTILSEAPENLPISEGMEENEKRKVNFFAKTEFKNASRVFGIKKVDRRRHMYVIGKTGTGKSTLIANMAINDMRNGEGLAVIDPHGDLVETLLDFVPKNRINDVVYLNPADTEATFRLNLLESSPEQKDLVASGIVAIFQKLYEHSWGPRLEYILRNTILALLEMPGANLLMVPKMLADRKYRKEVVPKIKDPVIRSFWENEFEQMQPRQQTEAIAPIQNKVGQFLSSGKIRKIVGHPKSTVDLEEAMNGQKIVLFNLSQGKIGEDSSALLGAMTITKLQLAAMNRVNITEEERKDFYLYVDEFQNFATNSFIKILSEARKYRLNLILANQYMGQLSEELRSAIFGNVGTLLSFIVGAEDMEYLAHEFGERFTTEDILSLGNHQALTKLAIDGITSAPFHAYTLPLPHGVNKNREKVLTVSRERYGVKNEDEDFSQSEEAYEKEEVKEKGSDFSPKRSSENRPKRDDSSYQKSIKREKRDDEKIAKETNKGQQKKETYVYKPKEKESVKDSKIKNDDESVRNLEKKVNELKSQNSNTSESELKIKRRAGNDGSKVTNRQEEKSENVKSDSQNQKVIRNQKNNDNKNSNNKSLPKEGTLFSS